MALQTVDFFFLKIGNRGYVFKSTLAVLCMLGGSVVVWTKNILYQLTKSQTQFGMPRGPEMSLACNELK